jgi:hypothetical protein
MWHRIGLTSARDVSKARGAGPHGARDRRQRSDDGRRPVLLRVDAAAIAEARAAALGLDVDMQLGQVHLHFSWSAIPLFPPSTKTDTQQL